LRGPLRRKWEEIFGVGGAWSAGQATQTGVGTTSCVMEGNEGGFGGQLQKRSGAARRRQRMDRAPRAARRRAPAPHSMSTQRSATGRGAASRSRWVASSAVDGEISLGRQAAPLAFSLTSEPSPMVLSDCGQPTLCLKCLMPAPGRLKTGLAGPGRKIFVQHRLGQLGAARPGAGRCLGSPRTARTGCPPPGPRASLRESKISHHGPLVSIGRVRTSRPASGTSLGCLERVRAGAVASMEHKMGHRKRLPKTPKTMPRR